MIQQPSSVLISRINFDFCTTACSRYQPREIGVRYHGTMIPFEVFIDAAKAEQDAILATLFEPCPALNGLIRNTVLPGNSYTTFLEFIDGVRTALMALVEESVHNPLSIESLQQIVCAHPRLGAADPASLLLHLRQEQQSLQGRQQELQQLKQLNAEYERAFPGLRYVVFVNQRPHSEIVKDMRDRIGENNVHEEYRRALLAMCDIAESRLDKL